MHYLVLQQLVCLFLFLLIDINVFMLENYLLKKKQLILMIIHDDENNDTDSRDLSLQWNTRRSSKIEDPDARAIENARNENNIIESSRNT